jgi:hypothetical protein
MSSLLGEAAPPLASVREVAAEEVAREFGFGRIEWASADHAFRMTERCEL